MDKTLRRNLLIFGVAGLVIIAAGAAAAYFILTGGSVSIDTASIEAPLIDLAPISSGRLNAVYVHEGDSVAANAPVAEVGTEIVTAKVAGIIVDVHDTVGANINSGDAVVTEIDPTQLRVVGSLKEDEGLAQIQVGDRVDFTVDAFGGKTFAAVVDEVAPSSNASDVVFSVSSQREEQTFDVKARFDISEYPQLENGMSARMTVYTGS